MNSLKDLKEILKIEHPDPEKINEFIIEMSNNATEEELSIIDYLIKNINSSTFEKVALNIAYLIGEIGNKILIPQKYVDLLHSIYFKSDRWIRDEVIQALFKTHGKKPISEKTLNLINIALKEDYERIRKNALLFVKELKVVRPDILKSIFYILNEENETIYILSSQIIQKLRMNEEGLFFLLNNSSFLKNINKRIFRKILTIFFDNPLKMTSLKNFRTRVIDSEWGENKKEMFIREIDTYSRIFFKTF